MSINLRNISTVLGIPLVLSGLFVCTKVVAAKMELLQQSKVLGESTTFNPSPSGSVLAATKSTDEFLFSINVPASFVNTVKFSDTVEFLQDIIAPNIVSSLTSGKGITISSGQNPTITNTGVLSLQSKTGELNLTAGDGITLDGLKITNSGILSLTAGTNISIDGNKITNTYVAPAIDYGLSGWTDSGSTVNLTTTTDSVVMDTITFGNAMVTNGKAVVPSVDLGADLGSSSKRFNNLWVANINSNSSQSFSGQTTFSYAPTDTTISQASILINPTTSATNGQLLGLGIAGYQRALIDKDGDIVLGYNSATSAPTTDYPLNIYGHNGTRVSYTDTSGNSYFAGNVGIGTTVAAYKLDVSASGGTNGTPIYTARFLNSDSGYGNNGVLIQTTQSSDNTNVLLLKQSTNTILSVRGNGFSDFGGDGITNYAKLGVIGGTADFPTLLARGAGTSTNVTFQTQNSSGIPLVTMLNSGNVGIGTTAPAKALHLYGSGEDLLRIEGSTSSTSPGYISFYAAGIATGYLGTSGASVVSGGGSDLALRSQGGLRFASGGATERMRLSSSGGLVLGNSYISTDPGAGSMIVSGNVGIGTTNPLSALHVAGTTGITWNGGGGSISYGLVTIGNAGSGGSFLVNTPSLSSDWSSGLGINGSFSSTRSVININAYGVKSGAYGSDLAFSTTRLGSLTEAMRIDTNGNVGIGTTSPTYPLSVIGSVYNSAYIYSSGGSVFISNHNFQGNSSDLTFSNQNLSGKTHIVTNNINRLTVDSTGNVGIGTTAPTQKLSVMNGTIALEGGGIWPLIYRNSSTGGLTLDSSASVGSGSLLSVKNNGGIDVLTALGTGNVGIGTTAPAKKLEVTTTADTTLRIKTTSQSTNDTTSLEVFGEDNTGWTLSNGNYGGANGSTLLINRANPSYFKIGNTAEASTDLQLGFFNSFSTAGIKLVTDNETRMYIKSGGNVGIGTTAPDGKFQIVDTTPGQTPGLKMYGITTTQMRLATTGTASEISFNTGNENLILGGNRLALTPGAIGGSTTTSAFQLSQTWNTTGVVDGAFRMAITETASGANSSLFSIYGGASATTNYLTVLKGGNVGIGTTAPATTLEVNGKTTLAAGSTGGIKFAGLTSAIYSNGNGITLSSNDGTTYFGANGFAIKDYVYSTTTAGLMRYLPLEGISGTTGTPGFIDISGTFNPASGTPTNRGIYLNPTINWGGTPGAGSYEALNISAIETALPTGTNYLIRARAGSAGTIDKFTITNGGQGYFAGNVGIGTTAPAYALDVKASGTGIIARFNSTNSSGCTLADGGTISCSSDRNLKKNISSLNYGLLDIMKLNPVAFNWNFDADNKTKSLGFIAQDIEEVMPGLVTVDSNGFRSLNTIGLVPVLAKAIQQQQIKIDELSLSSASASISSSEWSSLKSLVESIDNRLTAFVKQIMERFRTKELCLGEDENVTCIKKDQLDQLIKLLPTPTPGAWILDQVRDDRGGLVPMITPTTTPTGTVEDLMDSPGVPSTSPASWRGNDSGEFGVTSIATSSAEI